MEFDETSFPVQVYTVVASIPEGKVTTYGSIARLAGFPYYARHVGTLLSRLPQGSTLPWFRVINSQGKISLTGPDFIRQRDALLAEGILFSQSGRISFKKYGWLTEP